MSIIRIVPDLTGDGVKRIIAMVKVDSGTFEQIDQGDGKFTIIAVYPDLPEPAVELPSEDSNEFGWMKVALGEIGQKEAAGAADNPRVVEYHATVKNLGSKRDSVPWCSSFVNFCMEKSGIQGTDSALAQSWKDWGREINEFVPGCVVVLKRGKPPQGHVGFYVGMDGDRIRLLGGNQSSEVNISSFDVDRVIAKRLPVASAKSSLPPSNLSRWIAALTVANTTGASTMTASQDGLPPGIESSREMAKNDLPEAKALSDKFRKAGAKFDVPVAILAAIASRESRCGKVLKPDGTGDRGNGFGVMQVDKRHYILRGTPDPKSLEHIEQAAEIFARFRSQVKFKHPSWADKDVLKGAAVAYNSGINNVDTIPHMDANTTGNDYGSDVIARAQFFSTMLT